jgi:quinol-cytochrome oxidoreductase complex cytochrome b subunit
MRVRGLAFFPNFLLREVVIMFTTAASIFLLASLFPASLLEPANPFETPKPIFPEWYFLYVYGFLKFWTWDIGPLKAKTLGIIISMVLFPLLLFLVPFIDRNPEVNLKRRPIAVLLGVITVAAVLFFTIYGIIFE